MTKTLLHHQSQITDKYIEFLTDLKNYDAPVFQLFEGEPSEEKRNTFIKVLKFISVLNKRMVKAGVECDAHDILAELLKGLDTHKLRLIEARKYDLETEAFIQRANHLITKIGNFLYQGYLVEKENHNLSIVPLTLPEVDFKNMRNMISQNLQKMPEAIICADGKVYPAKDMHDLLVQFLIANNVDITSAVRVDAIEIGYNVKANSNNGRIIFSSLDQFSYMWKELCQDKTVWLTKEQADSMYKFFLEVKKCYPELSCSFKDVLLASENLGWQAEGNERNALSYYNNNATKNNIELLGDAVIMQHNKSGKNHADLAVLNMADDLVTQNNIRRSILVSKNALKVISSKKSSHTTSLE